MASTVPLATVLGTFYATDAPQLCALVASQIDERFIRGEVAKGPRIMWAEIAKAMTSASGRPWTEPQCQRLWRFCAYGIDIGIRKSTMPDSDGEDDNGRESDARNEQINAATRRIVDKAAQEVLNAVADAPHGGAIDTRILLPSPAVDAAALTLAAHNAVHAQIVQMLGEPPQKRTARDLFDEQKRAAATARVSVVQQTTAAQVDAAKAALEAAPEDEALKAAHQAAAHRYDVTRALTPEVILKQAWDAQPAEARQQFAVKEEALERPWIAQRRVYNERYAAMYRLIASHSLLSHLSTHAGR